MTSNEWLKGEVCEVNPRTRIKVFGISSFYLNIDKLPSNLVLHMYTDVEVKLDSKHERIVDIRKPLQ